MHTSKQSQFVLKITYNFKKALLFIFQKLSTF